MKLFAIIGRISKFLLRKIHIIVLLLIIVGLITYKRSAPVSLVRKVEITQTVVERTLTASGKMHADADYSLSFPLSGKIASLTVSEGDKVNKGQFLASVDSTSASQTAKSLRDARDIALRNRDLFVFEKEENIDSLGGETQYEITLRKYNEEVDRAEAAYQAQVASINNTYLYSPVDGTVVEVPYSLSEVASAGQTIVRIANLSELYFEAEIDQEDIGLLNNPQGITVNLDAYSNVEFPGEIIYISPFANSGTGTFDVRVRITDTLGKTIYLGMDGDLSVVLQKTSGDTSAVLYDEIFYDLEDRPFVWVVDAQNTLRKRYIEVGLEGDIYTEVVNPPSETIVVPSTDTEEIEEGNTARIV